MKTAKVTFYRAVLPFQERGQDQDQAIAELYFTVDMGDRSIDDSASVWQRTGDRLQSAPLEVAVPAATGRLLDADQFKAKALEYYQNLLMAPDAGMMAPGPEQSRNENRIFAVRMETRVEARA